MRFNIFHRQHEAVNTRLPIRFALTLGAIGVVYGDIGTSPLYAVNQAFFGIGHEAVTRENVLGIIGMIFWLLTLIVSIKYIFIVLRAEYQGEGGVFALHELLAGFKRKSTSALLMLLVFAAALLLGDGMITPAISVLSAVEGLNMATPMFTPYVLYISAAILIGLFLVQRKGTSKVGLWFGPVMVVWFLVIAGIGLHHIMQVPDILNAINPVHAFEFARSVGVFKLLIAIGAVTLAVTGAESLYADLGHFGKRPIRQGWFYLAYGALVLNYFGQGAYLLSGKPIISENIFFSMLPHLNVPANLVQWLPSWAVAHIADVPIYLMVALATAATIIASQALITGAFTLASQAMALGLAPRLNIVHTNKDHPGQIYVPAINWLLLIGCLLLVFIFRSSSNLGAAYGLAVTGVMVATSAVMYQIARYRWHWPKTPAIIVFRFFLAIDLLLLTANALKFFEGGYVPVIVAILLFTIVLTWRWGRDFVRSAYSGYISYTTPKTMTWLVDLKRRLQEQTVLTDRPRRMVEIDRGVVFLISKPVTSLASHVPIIVRIFMKRQGALPKHLVLLTIRQEKKPFVSAKNRIEIVDFGYHIMVVTAHYGFMQIPDGIALLKSLKKDHGMGPELHRCTVEAAEEELFIRKNAHRRDKVRVGVYKFFSRISPPAYHYFRLDKKPGLSKTIVPIILSRNGWRIDIPEYALERDEERIDPDTRKPTDLRYTRIQRRVDETTEQINN